MLKNILKIGSAFLVVCIIILLLWYIYGCVTNNEKANQSDNIPNNDNIEIISKLDTDFIDENHILEYSIQIDNNNYFLISRNKKPDGGLGYEYTIYKYNIHNGLHLKNVQFNRHFQYMGISNESKTLWITLEDIENNNKEDNKIWEIDYENMIVKNEYANTREARNLKISQDNSKWLYTTNIGMYVSDIEFKNEKLLLKHIPDKKDEVNSKSYAPYEVLGNKVIYAKFGYEWVEGLGIIDINDDSNSYVDLLEPSYLAYKDNNIYFTQSYKPKTIIKMNMDTLQQEEVFKLDAQDINEPDINIYLSSDLKYILVDRIKYLDGVRKNMLKIYDYNTKNLISAHSLSLEENIHNIGFSNNKIIFINLYELYSWNFLEGKGE